MPKYESTEEWMERIKNKVFSDYKENDILTPEDCKRKEKPYPDYKVKWDN